MSLKVIGNSAILYRVRMIDILSQSSVTTVSVLYRFRNIVIFMK